MKFATILLLLVSSVAFGQKKEETIKVWGNCGMCKKTIETAAKSAGATTANWDDETKILQVSYKANKTSSDKIQQAIANVGYDTEKYTADDKVYDQLHGCCKYDRKEASATAAKADCCKDGKCKDGNADCCKDGKCKDGSAECCKDGKCADGKHADCCKDGKCGKH
jgi:mercuric ion binding protein